MHVEQQLTTFTEDANVSQDKQYIKAPVPNPYETETIKDWLSRPYPIAHVRWSSASAVGDRLTSAQFPQDLFAIDSVWDKVKNFHFFRANVKISIRMNGTKTHYGKLIAMWSPYPGYHTETFNRTTNVYSISGFPHVMISPTENEVNELVIPFMSPLEFTKLNPASINSTSRDYEKFNFGGVYVYVLNTLQNVSGGSTEVSFTLFANFENIELAGYTCQSPEKPSISVAPPYTKCLYPVKNEFRAQAKKVRRQQPAPIQEAEEKAKQGVIGSTLEKVGNVAGSLSSVPVIGSIASVVSPIANVLGGIANVFGWNKPDSLEPRTAVINRYIDSSLTHGIDTSVKLALLPDNCVSSGLPFLGNNCKMDFDSICATPMLIGIYNWAPTDAESDILLQLPVTPSYEFPDERETVTWYYPTYLSHIAKAFTYWRGDLRYYIQITASAFHSGRLRVWYDPDDNSNPTTGIDGSNVVSKVIDIQTETDLAFTVPYLAHTPYRTVKYSNVKRATGMNNSPLGDSGRIGVSVLNELTSSSVPIQPVYINVWVSGVNMQFGAPTDVVFDTTEDDPIFAQGITSESIAKMEYKPLIHAKTSREEGICMGEHADHVKDLIMRPCPIIYYHEVTNPEPSLSIHHAYYRVDPPNNVYGEFDVPLLEGTQYEYRIWGQAPRTTSIRIGIAEAEQETDDALYLVDASAIDVQGQDPPRPIWYGKVYVERPFTHLVVETGPVALEQTHFQATFTEIKIPLEDRPLPDPKVMDKTFKPGNDLRINVPNPFRRNLYRNPGDEDPTACPYASYLAYFGSIFRFWRGSVRYKLFEMRSKNYSTKAARIIHNKMEFDGDVIIRGQTANFSRGFHQGLTSVRDPVSNALEVTVPYYSETLCHMNNGYKYPDPLTVVFDLVQDKYNQSSEAEGYILSSAGDDFEFGFLVPPPYRVVHKVDP